MSTRRRRHPKRRNIKRPSSAVPMPTPVKALPPAGQARRSKWLNALETIKPGPWYLLSRDVHQSTRSNITKLLKDKGITAYELTTRRTDATTNRDGRTTLYARRRPRGRRKGGS